jgi:hypothetical protein
LGGHEALFSDGQKMVARSWRTLVFWRAERSGELGRSEGRRKAQAPAVRLGLQLMQNLSATG